MFAGKAGAYPSEPPFDPHALAILFKKLNTQRRGEGYLFSHSSDPCVYGRVRPLPTNQVLSSIVGIARGLYYKTFYSLNFGISTIS
jgi:hypothetical protein